MASAQRVVVVGAGLAGVRVVEQLREHGYDGAVTLLGEEAEAPYDRPPLSKQVLRGEREVVPLRAAEAYAELAADLRLGRRVTAVEVEARRVVVDDGTTVGFDALVLAPGARPRTLPVPGGTTGVHVLRTATDCRGLAAAVTAGARRAVVVGGGFIGCEVASSLRALGLDVTIVELASAPLVTVLGEELAAYLSSLHEAAGVQLRCGVGVSGLETARGVVTGVRLADGGVVPADVVVVGLGVTPATEFLVGSGVALAEDGGICCDEYGATSVPHVWALGDAAAWRNPRTELQRRVEHWTSAVEQAGLVAANILGGRSVHDAVPYFWSDQQWGPKQKVKIQSLGSTAGHDQVEVLPLTETKRLGLYARDDVLIGVVGFACPSAVMRMRPLLETATSLADAVEHARAATAATS